MSYDISLFKKDKTNISKTKLESILWKQHWIARSSEKDTYVFWHNEDQSYIEISRGYFEIDYSLSSSKKINSIELRTWASSSEWTINHLIRLSFLLAEKLDLTVYDSQIGKEISVKDIDKLVKSYLEWRTWVDAINLKLDINPKDLVSITVFIAHSFLPCDDLVNDYIIDYFRNKVKKVLTGRPYQTDSISKKVKEKIRESDLVVAVLTKREKISKGKYKTSEWVKDEATFAAGAKKDILFMKEENVIDLPGIFGDYEWIKLNRYYLKGTIEKVDEYLKVYKNNIS